MARASVDTILLLLSLCGYCGGSPLSQGDVTVRGCRLIATDGCDTDLTPLSQLDSRLQTVDGDGWRYSFNPCQPHNLPSDPHQANGDGCFSVLMCRWKSDSTDNEKKSIEKYYGLGITRTAKFIQKVTDIPRNLPPIQYDCRRSSEEWRGESDESESHGDEGDVSREEGGGAGKEEEEDEAGDPRNMIHAPGTAVHGTAVVGTADVSAELGASENLTLSESSSISSEEDHDRADLVYKVNVISLRGIGSLENTKTFIYLMCDWKRRRPEQALFREIKNTSVKSFQLRHICCCEGACVGGALPSLRIWNTTKTDSWTSHNTSSEVLIDSPNESSQKQVPRSIWLLLVINLVVMLTAITIGGACCKRGGGVTRQYNYLPPTIPRSRTTLGSSESLYQHMLEINPAYPDRLDYTSSLHSKAKLPESVTGVIPNHALEIGQRLGGGFFGDTYLGTWKDRTVACKRFSAGCRRNELADEEYTWIIKVVLYLSQQRHKNVVAALGLCIDVKQIYMVSEFVNGESLRDLLKRDDDSLTWPRKVKLCMQAAEGLKFLHSSKPVVLHRDFRAANLLVDLSKEQLKVADYGQKEKAALPASARWTAPEILANPTADEYNHDVMSTACDVYSFSMVLIEVVTCAEPYPDLDESQVLEIVLEGNRPRIDNLWNTGVVPQYLELTKLCWEKNPDARPNMKQICSALKTVHSAFTKSPSQLQLRTDSTTTNYLKSALNI